jgi:peptidyl-prolyl cis-trans isomerase SurA
MSQMLKMLVEKLVDEELERRAANQARIAVSAQEIDDSIDRIARQQNLTYDQIVDEAVKSGLTEAEYRQEIRRQVLEAKLLNLRVVARIRITEEDLRGTYRRIVMDERKQLGFRAAWVRIDGVGAADQSLARAVARRAKAGEDFAALARAHSDDDRTREAGGLLGPLTPGRLPPLLDKVVLASEVGEVSRPVRVGESLFVIKLLEREESELPTFAQAQNELRERVYLEKMDRARRHWLDGLRRRTHVDVRL